MSFALLFAVLAALEGFAALDAASLNRVLSMVGFLALGVGAFLVPAPLSQSIREGMRSSTGLRIGPVWLNVVLTLGGLSCLLAGLWLRHAGASA
ncbi:hypothetical protein [Inhella proteolytica]|uniref:Uncharacterized protein n=1 Tax=Inhella proteolytica TaxID=2795029 RepID=A0A931NFF0_9BURK|nr:hypothetical protein [Inhella proteolytica]MBH9575553.1 hypothetical protein [Inhella proteolytica]